MHIKLKKLSTACYNLFRNILFFPHNQKGNDMKKNGRHQKTRHHIIPTSRVRGKGILCVCEVPRQQHELYHSLFGNMTPDEIVIWLNDTFWNGQYDLTIERR